MAENKTWEQEAGRVGATLLDPFAQLVLGVSDALEGVVDLGIGAVGAVGGLFSEDFREGARDAIEYDFTGEVLEKTMDDAGLSHSYLNDHPVGEVAQEVFRGVGNMLPAVAASVLTVGAAAPAMGTAAAQAAGQTAGLVALGGSAAGGATEEAFRDGAGYYEGLGYGAASGAVEVATEKLFGGVTGKVFGKGMLDDVSGAVAKTGARRVLSNMGEEAVEEAAATFVNPALKSIYRGRDAWSEYGDPAFYGEVGRSALVGGLTSAVYGGTVGHAMHTSGKDADIADSMEEIGGLRRKQMNLWASDALTDDARARLLSVARGNLANVEAALQKASVKERARLIEQHRLSELVDADGKLRPHAAEKLINEPIGVETEGSRDAGASFDRRYMSPGLWNKRADVQAELDRINADLRQKYGFSEDFAAAGVDNGEVVQYNKKYPKRKKVVQTYSQYATEVMIWARSAARSIGDTRIFYDEQTNTYNKIVVDDSEDGYGIYDSIEATPRNEQAIQLLYEEVNHDRNRAEQGTHQGIYENYDRFKRLQRRYVHDGNSTQIDRTDDRAGRMDGKATAGDFDGAGNRGESTGDQQSKVKYSPKPTPDAAFNIEIFEGELSEQAQKNYLQMKKAFSKLSEKTPTGMHFVLVKPNEYINGAILQDGNTVYIAADTLENGTWAQKLVHEVMHFAEGSREYKKLVKHLAKDSEAVAKAVDSVGSVSYSEKSESNRKPVLAIQADSELAQRIAKSSKSKYTVIRDYLVEKFYGDTFTLSDGKQAIMDKRDAQELAHKADDAKSVELANLRLLIENAELYAEDYEVTHNKFDAFSYYEITVRIDNVEHNLLLNVGRSKYDGKYHIYDITKNRRTAHRSSTDVSRPVGYAIKSSPSTNSIPETESNVKSFAEKIMDGEDLELSGELAAQMAEEVLGNEEFIGRLVNEDAPLAEKIMGKIRDLIRAFSRLNDPAARAEHKRLQKAEKLYLTAVEHAGYRYVGGKLQKALANDEEEPGEQTAETVSYSLKSFSKQVDDVLSGADTMSTHLKVMDTPKLLQDAGLPALPILLTAQHLKTISGKSGKENANYHDLDVSIVKQLPQYIEDPILIADSFTREDSVVIITEAVDSQKRPVIAAIKLDGRGQLDQKYIKANILASAYGKDNFQSFIDRIAETGSVIYWNKTKSQDMAVNLGIQFPNVISNLDSNTIIRKAKAFVKRNEQKNKGKISYSLKPHVPDATEAKRNFALTKTAVQKAERTEKINDPGGEVRGKDLDQSQISLGMSDNDRYKRLKSRQLSLSAVANIQRLSAIQEKLGFFDQDVEFSKYGDRVRLFKKLGEEFSVFHGYRSNDIALDFSFSKENMRESVSKQRRNYINFAKMLTCLNTVIDNAVGIEVHNRNVEGYKNDNSLKNVYVLASAFVDGTDIIPVKLEVKEFSDKENTLHVAIALESIKQDGIVKQEVAKDGVARQDSPPSNISIADFFQKINPTDESFYKYIPKQFLTQGNGGVSYSLKQSARTEKINDLKRTIKERDEVYRLSNRVLELAGQIRDLKLGTYHSVSEFNDARFRGSIEQLASIKLRGNLSVPKIRKVMSDLYGWYDPESPFFAEQQDLIRPEVREMMTYIGSSELK